MDEFGSDGKGVEAEGEGSTAPLPSRVQVGGSLAYRVDRKLGKGGFGQVHVGRRINPPNPNERIGPGAIELFHLTPAVWKYRDAQIKNSDIESRRCGPCSHLYLQSLAWAMTTEPRTGVEFPTMLDNNTSGESNSSFSPEILVGTGSRTMTIIRIRSLSVYAFGFYVHPSI